MKLIDFHAHCFPDKLAERAMHVLAEEGGNMLVYGKGTVDDLVTVMDQQQVDLSVVLNIATNEKQMPKVNDFAIAVDGYKGRVVSFGSVYPHGEGAISELYRLKENGIKGIKLHPEYQSFYVDDDKLTLMYETITKLGLITVFHAGLDVGFVNTGKASVLRFKETLKALKSPVVLAHMGGYMEWGLVEQHLVGNMVYFDTSFCFSRIPLPQMKAIVAGHGADKIVFGSDMPWSTPLLEMRLIDVLGLSDEDKAKITHLNAEGLLGRIK